MPKPSLVIVDSRRSHPLFSPLSRLAINVSVAFTQAQLQPRGCCPVSRQGGCRVCRAQMLALGRHLPMLRALLLYAYKLSTHILCSHCTKEADSTIKLRGYSCEINSVHLSLQIHARQAWYLVLPPQGLPPCMRGLAVA